MKTDDIENILYKLGFKLFDKGNYWNTNAIWRNGDNFTAIQIYKDSGVWRDFVDQSGPAPFQLLVSKVLGTKDPRVLRDYNIDKKSEVDIFENIDKKHTITMDKVYDKTVLKDLLPHHDFYLKRKISQGTLDQYQSGFATLGQMNNRYVFPIFSYEDPDKIIGFTGRSFLWKPENENISKWKHIGSKRKWIYPLCLSEKFKSSVRNTRSIYLVESIGDSLALTENNILNHMVIFGVDLSSDQLMTILSFAPSKIIIAMNNDSAGIKAAIKHFVSLMDYFDISSIYIKLPQMNDLSEMHENGKLHSWEEKKIDHRNQIEHIVKFLINNKNSFTKKADVVSKIKLLKEYLGEDQF